MSSTPATIVVKVEDLFKGYGTGLAVDNLSLTIQSGEIFGILGLNGAGKTTLMEMIVGLRRPSSGHLETLGHDPQLDRHRFTIHVNIQPQSAGLFEHLTVVETLTLFQSFYDHPLPVEQVLQEVGLGEKRKALVRRLSGGQRHRLLVGLALIGNGDLLFLDEPTGSLDPEARRLLWDVILKRRTAGKTIVLTTHSMEEAYALCDRIAILYEGRILALGRPDDLIKTHLPEQVIHFELPTSNDEWLLRALPGVAKVDMHPNGAMAQVRLWTETPETTLKALFSSDSLSTPLNVRLEQGTLEQLFLYLVRQQSEKGVPS
jgi:ABC-2 type transport system ATP-binding protein